MKLTGYDIDNWDWKNPDYNRIYAERIKRLEFLRAHPEFVQRVIEHYRANPADFINDHGVTFDPRLAERGLRTVVPFVLFDRQREFINWTLDRWTRREDGVVEKSRDMGVSWLCVAFAAWMLIFRTGTVVGFGSRKEMYVDEIGNPASLFWKIREFINLLPMEFQPVGWDAKKHAPYMKIQNADNGSFITGEAGDSIGRGNRTSIYFVDEAAFLERPDAAEAALSQTSNCRIHVSTPNGAGNPFYRKAHDGRTPKFIFDWHDDPRKDEAWYRKQCETLDPVVVAQEIDRSYSASVENSFIPATIVQAAARLGPADVMPVGNIMIGIDVARMGNDKSVFVARQGRVLLKMERYSKIDLVDLTGRARQFVESMMAVGNVAQVAVDMIGMGSGPTDMLSRHFGGLVEGVNSAIRLSDGQYYNLRTRMYGEMREWLKAGASIPNDSDLITDLTALQYHFKGGTLLLESKDDAKKRGVKSPDSADALALTFAIPPKKFQHQPVVQESLGWAVLDSVTGY